MLCAFAALEPSALTPSAAIQRADFVNAIPPLTICRDCLVVPGAGMSNSNFWDCLEAEGSMRRFAGSSQASRNAKDPAKLSSAFCDIRFAAQHVTLHSSTASRHHHLCDRSVRGPFLVTLARSNRAISPQKFTRFEIAPSTTRFEPVVNEEAGLAKNTAAFAISCGVAMRPVGLRASASS